MSTNVRHSRSSSRSASSVRPVCAGEVWSRVLRGAVSQRNRWPRVVFRAGLLVEPSQVPHHSLRLSRSRSMSTPGSRARSRSASTEVLQRRNFSSAQYSSTPTFMNSPRSCRGTARSRAYSNTCGTCCLQGFCPLWCVGEAGGEEAGVAGPCLFRWGSVCGQPVVRDQGEDFGDQVRGDVEGADGAGGWEHHVVVG